MPPQKKISVFWSWIQHGFFGRKKMLAVRARSTALAVALGAVAATVAGAGAGAVGGEESSFSYSDVIDD